jgi:DNA-binding NarL/FixJ family response regulator
MAKIVLSGFDPETAKMLALKLAHLHHQPELLSYERTTQGLNSADLFILSGDDVQFRRSLANLIGKAPSTPVIVAGRTAEDALWLAALEAGAVDYCSIDVDPATLAWMVDNAVMHTPVLHTSKSNKLEALAGAA